MWTLNYEFYDVYDAFNVEEISSWEEKPTKQDVLMAIENRGLILTDPNLLFFSGKSWVDAVNSHNDYDGFCTFFLYKTWMAD